MTHGLYSRHKNIALAIKLWELMVDVWWEEDSFCTFLHLDRTFFFAKNALHDFFHLQRTVV